MKKAGKNVLSTLLLVTMLVGSLGSTCFAGNVSSLEEVGEESLEVEVLEAIVVEHVDMPSESNPYTMLASCIIGVRGDSDGMHIDISTGTVGKASVLGVKDVKVQKKTWYGGWTTVAVSDGGEAYDRTTMGIVLLYKGAEKGATYRISCIHYGDVDGYTEGENTTGEIVFTY